MSKAKWSWVHGFKSKFWTIKTKTRSPPSSPNDFAKFYTFLVCLWPWTSISRTNENITFDVPSSTKTDFRGVSVATGNWIISGEWENPKIESQSLISLNEILRSCENCFPGFRLPLSISSMVFLYKTYGSFRKILFLRFWSTEYD